MTLSHGYCRYPYNNALHHYVESILSTCMESRNDLVIDHLFKECDLVGKILDADGNPFLSADRDLVNACIAMCFISKFTLLRIPFVVTM